jgi:2-polyprenyl-6-methoxyphenol hydroxylase-like FAD-dependent oxidoreductase
MSHPPIAIAGAGIAGLATALALGERHVVVFEQASSFSPVGAGLQLGPNAVRALQKLGAWDAVAPSTSSPPEIHIRDGVSGRLLKQLPLGRAFEKRYGAPYQVALRADLHTGLLAVVKTRRNVVVELGQRIAVDSSSAQGVQVTTDCGQRLFEKLFATDGVQSAIRQSLFPGMQAIDAFETCHRAQVRTPDVSNVALDCVNLWFFPGGHHPKRCAAGNIFRTSGSRIARYLACCPWRFHSLARTLCRTAQTMVGRSRDAAGGCCPWYTAVPCPRGGHGPGRCSNASSGFGRRRNLATIHGRNRRLASPAHDINPYRQPPGGTRLSSQAHHATGPQHGVARGAR